jgi:hypothetical protein
MSECWRAPGTRGLESTVRFTVLLMTRQWQACQQNWPQQRIGCITYRTLVSRNQVDTSTNKRKAILMAIRRNFIMESGSLRVYLWSLAIGHSSAGMTSSTATVPCRRVWHSKTVRGRCRWCMRVLREEGCKSRKNALMCRRVVKVSERLFCWQLYHEVETAEKVYG